MIEDARRVPSGSELECEVCVVGAGPAGITVAIELARRGIPVVVLEAGGRSRAAGSLELYRGTVNDPVRHLPTDVARYRQLGGTSALWGGRCIPLDAIDLAPREHVPNSGWPIGRSELDPYYEKAHQYCECGAYEYRASRALGNAPGGLVSGLEEGEISTDTLERWSPPTHFGRRYRNLLEGASGARVLLRAVGRRLLGCPSRGVGGVEVATLGGNRFQVRARHVVLAGGGLEVARLLLLARREGVLGTGASGRWLGRGYMCHLTGVVARVRFAPHVAVRFGFERDADGVYCRRRFRIAPRAQLHHRLLNCHLLLDRPLLGNPEHGSAVLSLAWLAKTLVGRPDPTAGTGRGKFALYRRHLRNVLAGSPEIVSVLPRWGRSRFLQERRIPSLLRAPEGNEFYLHFQAEQAPDERSRVRLDEARDRLGVPRLAVEFGVGEQDVESIERTHRLLGEALERRGLGRLEFLEPEPGPLIARQQATLGHHIGTARMAGRAEDGVVDPHCRVFGAESLHVASSAVFPTSGEANPTLTIVALAVRLAEHLARVGKGAAPGGGLVERGRGGPALDGNPGSGEAA